MLKNAIFYHMPNPVEFVEEALNEHTDTPLAQTERSRMSWALHEQCEGPVLELMGFSYMRVRIQNRLLPASVLNDFTAHKVQEIEHNEDRKVGRKERAQIKDDEEIRLLPMAFVQTQFIDIYINQDKKLLIVGTSSMTVADEITALLRSSVKSLPLSPFSKGFQNIEQTYTNWVIDAETIPDGLALKERFKIGLLGDSGTTLSAKGLEHDNEGIISHINNGLSVLGLALELDDVGSFNIDANLTVGGFKGAESAFEETETEEDINASKILTHDLFSRLAGGIASWFEVAKKGEGNDIDSTISQVSETLAVEIKLAS